MSLNCILSKGVSLVSSSKLTQFCSILLKRNNAFPIVRMINTSTGDPPNFYESEEITTGLSAEQIRKRAQENCDWLPFDWKRRPKFNNFENSGDLVKEIEYDPSWPKPDFELSEELKTANDIVKHMYSLAAASKAEIKEVFKRRMLEKIQRHPTDFESLEVKIGLQTLQIRSLLLHQKEVKKDVRGGRTILYILILRRNKKLKILYRTDRERFNWICNELKLTYTPKLLGGVRAFYTRKWALRDLTKKYCANMLKEKKIAYHQELKQQQVEFQKEKEEILAWIEKEEKEIANMSAELANLNIDK